ncbi:MAG: serine hydrolase domain-containing protein [Chitinophagaceae bacterium]
MILKTLVLCFGFILGLLTCQNKKGADDKLKSHVQSVANEASLSKEEIQYYHDTVAHFLNSNLLKGSFNGAIIVAKEGTIVYEEYIGYKDLRTKDTLTAETPLQIASTTKTFTSAAILKLIQEGKLNLNDPVSLFFPGFTYEGVTVKTLLNHRSGLPNYLYYFDKYKWDKQMYITNTDVLQTLIQWKPPKSYIPNTRFNYCNTNFVLLASIIEKISGVSYPQYMEANFFEPLNMSNTFVFTLADSARASVSFDGYGRWWRMDYTDGTYGDKGIYSTPQDLLKWDQALNQGIISPQLLDSAFTPYSNERPSVHNYGLGWRLLMLPNGKKVIYHNGRWHGFNSAFTRLTDENIVIIILSNRFNRYVYSIARQMYNLFGDYEGKNGIPALDEQVGSTKP